MYKNKLKVNIFTQVVLKHGLSTTRVNILIYYLKNVYIVETECRVLERIYIWHKLCGQTKSSKIKIDQYYVCPDVKYQCRTEESHLYLRKGWQT